jgi:diaminopimelate decarboxylase
MTKYGSPLYVYDAKILKKKAEILTEAAKGFHISYAMKANSNSHIIKTLQDSGVKNVDVVSPG